MRVTSLAGTAILVGTVLGLTGCAQAEEQVRGQVRDQVRASCDRAVTSAEKSGALGGQTADQLQKELTGGIDEKYRGPMEEVARQIPAEAAKRGIEDGVDKAVPQEQRAQWHDMAVDVCTAEVASQLNVGGESGGGDGGSGDGDSGESDN